MTKNDENNEQEQHQVSKEDALNGWGAAPELLEIGVKDEQGNVHGATDIPRNADLENEEKVEDENDETEELDEPEEVELTNGLDDPGDYQPADYSFEVTIYTGPKGEEKPKTVKVHSVEEGERLLDDDPNFGTPRNLLAFNNKLFKMEAKLERDEEAHKAAKEAYDAQLEGQEDRQERINLVANELRYLETKKRLPEVAAKYRNADWNDPEIAKQPGVKEQLALLKYMAKENKERTKLGLSPVGALDAFNSMQAEAMSNKDATNKTTAATNRKTAGARVSGSSPAPVSGNAPKGIAVGRGGSLRDLETNWN